MARTSGTCTSAQLHWECPWWGSNLPGRRHLDLHVRQLDRQVNRRLEEGVGASIDTIKHGVLLDHADDVLHAQAEIIEDDVHFHLPREQQPVLGMLELD